uniref:Cation/H+ exchanger transmembrane domain-containing protein n=1 Tax=Timema bartmani TaxID=61472 RepID=A0A7R9F4P1_9NEOP|nr:unnamed protein product [Timema bartmani]
MQFMRDKFTDDDLEFVQKKKVYNIWGSFRKELRPPRVSKRSDASGDDVYKPILCALEIRSFRKFERERDYVGEKDITSPPALTPAGTSSTEKSPGLWRARLDCLTLVVSKVTSHPWCPCWMYFSRVTSLVLIGLLLWGILYSVGGNTASPGGQLFNLYVLYVTAILAGYVAHWCKLPPMVGMLLMGILLRNIGFLTVGGNYLRLVTFLRRIALMTILTRAGIELDPKHLERFSYVMLRLAIVPSVIEAVVVMLLTRYVMGLPWVWGMLLGGGLARTASQSAPLIKRLCLTLCGREASDARHFPVSTRVERTCWETSRSAGELRGRVLKRSFRVDKSVRRNGIILSSAAPAITIPTLFGLQLKGYGTDKDIPTLIIAASSFDEMLSLAFFGIPLGIMYTSDSIWMDIFRGPVGITIGLTVGITWGLLLKHVPEMWDEFVNIIRTLLLGLGGMMALLAGDIFGYESAGPIACMVASFISCHGWRSQGYTDQNNPVANCFAILWGIVQPILFSLIGGEVDLFSLGGEIVGLGLAVILGGLVVRLLVTVLIVSGTKFSWKEKLFVALSWFPKGTVPAALGPTALDLGRILHTHHGVTASSHLLIVAILSILVTAPLGSLLLNLLGPRLLTRPHRASQDITIVDVGAFSELNSGVVNRGFIIDAAADTTSA